MEYAICVEMYERYDIVHKEFAEEGMCRQTKSTMEEIFEDYKLAVIRGWIALTCGRPPCGRRLIGQDSIKHQLLAAGGHFP
jgi:hypothetical protein